MTLRGRKMLKWTLWLILLLLLGGIQSSPAFPQIGGTTAYAADDGGNLCGAAGNRD